MVGVTSLAINMLSCSYANDIIPSHVLIEQAYHSGKIDFEMEQLYKAYSLFDSSRLPKEFRSTIPGKCGTPILLELRQNYQLLSPDTRNKLSLYPIGTLDSFQLRQPRPSLSGPEQTISSINFIVHYTLEGKDAPPTSDSNPANGIPDFVDWILEAMETSWNTEINTMGWLQPPSDKGEGGDTRYDVYVVDEDYFGTTQWPMGLVGDNPNSSSVIETNAYYSYIEMSLKNEVVGDPDFTRQNIQVTASHELCHAIQAGYDAAPLSISILLLEGTAEWMADHVYDDANDFRFLPEYFQNPDHCLPRNMQRSPRWIYATFIFFHHIEEHYGGPNTVRSVWENAVLLDGMDAVSAAIADAGSNIETVFASFAVANLLLSTCPENAPYCYEEADIYKTVVTLDIENTINYTGSPISTTVLNGVKDNYSADYIALTASDNIEVLFQGTSPSASYGAQLVAVLNGNASVFPFPLTGSPLSGSVSLNADDYDSIHVVIVNTTPTELCPSTKIYGAYAEETKILRYFRDNVLSQTPAGQELIKAYYEWSPIILNAMEKNKDFEEEIKEMIDAMLPLIQEEAGDIYLPVCPNRSYRITVSPSADI
jgi:hypothetical protein